MQRRDELIEESKVFYDGKDPKESDVYIMLSTNLAPLVRVFDKYSYKFASHNKFVMTNEFVSGSKIIVHKDALHEDFDDLGDVLSDKKVLEPYEHPK